MTSLGQSCSSQSMKSPLALGVIANWPICFVTMTTKIHNLICRKKLCIWLCLMKFRGEFFYTLPIDLLSARSQLSLRILILSSDSRIGWISSSNSKAGHTPWWWICFLQTFPSNLQRHPESPSCPYPLSSTHSTPFLSWISHYRGLIVLDRPFYPWLFS